MNLSEVQNKMLECAEKLRTEDFVIVSGGSELVVELAKAVECVVVTTDRHMSDKIDCRKTWYGSGENSVGSRSGAYRGHRGLFVVDGRDAFNQGEVDFAIVHGSKVLLVVK